MPFAGAQLARRSVSLFQLVNGDKEKLTVMIVKLIVVFYKMSTGI